MKNSFKYIVSAALSLSLMVFIAACGKDDAAVPTSARLRFFNAVADAPTAGLDVLIDGSIINLRTYLTGGTALADSSFKYGAGFPGATDSSYLYLTEGSHNVKINSPVGSTTTSLTQDVVVAANKTYTAFVIDSLAKMGLLVIQDILPAPKNGKAYVRVAQLSPNAPSIDAIVKYVKTVSGVLTTLDSTSIAKGIAYKGVSDFVEVKAPDSLTLEFRTAGTLTSAVTFPKSALVAGRCYTIVARGFVGKASPLNLGTTSIIHGR
jgi:hypothetical protein